MTSEVKQEKINNIKNNKEYILWLEEFTKDNPYFNTELYIYYPGKYSLEEQEKIKDISLLYEVVDVYAKENYIYPTAVEHGDYYKIKYNNIGYKIQVMKGQGMRYLLNRVEVNIKNEFIDFDDILNNRKQKNVDTINLCLRLLGELIDNMIDYDVPISAIENTTKDTINKSLVKRKIKK